MELTDSGAEIKKRGDVERSQRAQSKPLRVLKGVEENAGIIITEAGGDHEQLY